MSADYNSKTAPPAAAAANGTTILLTTSELDTDSANFNSLVASEMPPQPGSAGASASADPLPLLPDPLPLLPDPFLLLPDGAGAGAGSAGQAGSAHALSLVGATHSTEESSTHPGSAGHAGSSAGHAGLAGSSAPLPLLPDPFDPLPLLSDGAGAGLAHASSPHAGAGHLGSGSEQPDLPDLPLPHSPDLLPFDPLPRTVHPAPYCCCSTRRIMRYSRACCNPRYGAWDVPPSITSIASTSIIT
jgi:hypothetical protein